MTDAGFADAWTEARTIGEWLALRRSATPDACAFRHETAPGQWQDVTWQQFATRVAALQRGLAGLGLRNGDRLALILPVGLEWELLHHAALCSGVVVVGLDSHDLPERLAGMAIQADVSAFAVSDARLWSRIRQAGGAALGQPWLITVAAAHDGGDGERWRSLADLERSAPQTTVAAPGPQDTATILFTSGTTGAPKGIAYSHAQLCLAVVAIADAFSFADRDSRLLCWLPLSNLFQRVVNLGGLRRGAATYLLADPRRVMEVVAVVEPDIFVGVPRFFEKLHEGITAGIGNQSSLRRSLAKWALTVGRRASQLQREGRGVSPLLALVHSLADRLVLRRIRRVMGSRLRCMVTGSAPMPRHLLEEFHAIGWLVLEAYGLSENVLPMALNRVGDFRFGSVGRPLPGNVIMVGADGELRVRGAGVFGGYLGRPPGEAIDADGYYATGDLGRFDADGFLYLIGRSDDMIKTSTGRRVAPAGVEAQLRAIPGVDQAVLVGAGRKALVALCTLAGPAPSGGKRRAQLEAQLRACVSQINEHERPVAIGLLDTPFSIDAGELTPNLKMRRSAIEARHSGLIDNAYRVADGTGAERPADLPVLSA